MKFTFNPFTGNFDALPSAVKPFTIGDGAATVFDLVHNFNSADAKIAIYRISDGAESFPRTKRLDVNTVRVTFAQPIALNSYRVLVTPVT